MATPIFTTHSFPAIPPQPKSPHPLEEDKHDIAGQGGHIGRLLQSFSCSQLSDEGGNGTFSPWGHIPEKGTTVQLGTADKAGEVHFEKGNSGQAPVPLSCSGQENIHILRRWLEPQSPTAQIPLCLRLPTVATQTPHMPKTGLPALSVPALLTLIRGQHSPGWQPPQPCHRAPTSQRYLQA